MPKSRSREWMFSRSGKETDSGVRRRWLYFQRMYIIWALSYRLLLHIKECVKVALHCPQLYCCETMMDRPFYPFLWFSILNYTFCPILPFEASTFTWCTYSSEKHWRLQSPTYVSWCWHDLENVAFWIKNISSENHLWNLTVNDIITPVGGNKVVPFYQLKRNHSWVGNGSWIDNVNHIVLY